MIVLDANILLYAYDADSAQHRPSRAYLEKIFSASDPVGLPIQSISVFLRIMTQQGLRSGCFSLPEAV